MIATLAVLALVVTSQLLESQSPIARADSVAILRAVQGEQEKLERIRRDDLPTTSGGGFDHCDENVGFHCFVYGDPEEVWSAPKASQAFSDARDSLLARLDRAAAQLPGDWWIAGQRVRYLVEAGQPNTARTAAAECRPEEEWWCLALAGYAAHAAEEYGPAEAAFDEALAVMSPEQRCKWTDISLLISDAPPRIYRELDCEAREAPERRFWWLADPLYLVAGNERRSEHFSRHVAVRFEEDAPSVSPRQWTSATALWLIRYGTPAGWERKETSSFMFTSDPEILVHYRGPSEVFEPSWRILERPAALLPEDFPLRPRGAKTGYVPAYAQRFDTLRYQVAVFRRNDSAVVLAAYELSSDSVDSGTPAVGGLYLTGNETESPRGSRQIGFASDVLTLAEVPKPRLLSLEVITGDGRRAGRARYWLPLAPTSPEEMALSDILLLSRDDSLPHTFDEAMPLARRGTSVGYQETLGLYWEIYGVGAGSTPISLSLTLEKEGSSWLRRATRKIGLGREGRPAVSLKWTERSQPGTGPTTGAIALDLAKNDPGRYTLHLKVTSQGRGTGSSRQIIIGPKTLTR